MSDLLAQITAITDPTDFPRRRATFIPPERVTIGRTISRDPDEDDWRTGVLVEETEELFELLLDGDIHTTCFPKYDRAGNRLYTRAATATR